MIVICLCGYQILVSCAALISYSLSYRYMIIFLHPSWMCLPAFLEQTSAYKHANVNLFFSKISSMTLWRTLTKNAGARKIRLLEFLWNANKKSGIQVIHLKCWQHLQNIFAIFQFLYQVVLMNIQIRKKLGRQRNQIVIDDNSDMQDMQQIANIFITVCNALLQKA